MVINSVFFLTFLDNSMLIFFSNTKHDLVHAMRAVVAWLEVRSAPALSWSPDVLKGLPGKRRTAEEILGSCTVFSLP